LNICNEWFVGPGLLRRDHVVEIYFEAGGRLAGKKVVVNVEIIASW
jgi:hypothetical protein